MVKTLNKICANALAIVMLVGIFTITPMGVIAENNPNDSSLIFSYLSLENIYVSHNMKVAETGDTITINAKVTDPLNSHLSYRLYVDNKIVVESEEPKLEYTFKNAGKFLVKYEACNSLGNCAEFFRESYIVTEPNNVPLITSILCAPESEDGADIIYNVKSEDGAGDTKYKYILYKDFPSFEVFDNSEADKPDVIYQTYYISEPQIRIPAELLKNNVDLSYHLSVKAKDKDGNESKSAVIKVEFCTPTSEEITEPAQPATEKPTEQVVAEKRENSVKITVKNTTIKAKKLKVKAQKIKPITIKNEQGKVSYKLAKSGISKKIRKLVKINSKGVITFNKWKKAEKGVYKFKVKITAKGNEKYKPKKVTKTVKIRVK